VIEACRKFGAVYFAGLGGAGALMSQCVKSAEVVAYEDLGPEAVRRLVVEAMPLVVINDTRGRDLYAEGRKKYQLR
jgi:fumarate hydratase subunit beta